MLQEKFDIILDVALNSAKLSPKDKFCSSGFQSVVFRASRGFVMAERYDNEGKFLLVFDF